MKNKLLIIMLTLLLGFSSILLGQGRLYEGPDDSAGDEAAKSKGWMTGNRVLLFFRNTTELSNCCALGYDVSKWPNNNDGTKMHDGIAILLGARVFLENDSIPVDDINEVESRTDLDTLYYCQSSYREYLDMDPTGTITWALYPAWGYHNPLGETPAMSNMPESWPVEGWPASNGEGLKWPGEWNGRFGRGQIKSDLECFFVANDAQDQEYLEDEDTVKYYPRRKNPLDPNSGVLIGDKNPNVTIQKGLPWGGIGIRVEARGFQWSNPQAQDAIFWEYNVSNISEYNLTQCYFGLYIDNAVGGEEGDGDDIAYYSKELNMCYSWDIDFRPVGGGKEPGVLGMAFLESPGIPHDELDNDSDGLIDERRDNIANVIVPADYHLPTDEQKKNFLRYYFDMNTDGMSSADVQAACDTLLREHWDADEDQDWTPGIDANGNGKYAFWDTVSLTWALEPGESVGDDVGLDGMGPFDLNYTGPDADGTEGNNKPDFKEGYGSEPNFASTDVSESDMLGLTNFHYVFKWGIDGYSIRNDQLTFEGNTDGAFDDAQMEPQNFVEQFASGIFPLYKGLTERISMSELHAYDPLEGLMIVGEHKSPALFRLKKVVQIIYETDYRFAQPPEMPTLTAIPGDGKVTLTWDDRSDRYTRDPFVGNKNDFEGYKLYKATDKKMSDAEVITDAYGTPMLKKPIFQCDLKNDIKGTADFGLVNGVAYYLGDDSGIQHYYVDENVDNGRTYYYVLVAYDYGIPDVGDGITPSENIFVIDLDEAENIRKVSQNVAVVKPRQKAAGYIPPSIQWHEDLKVDGTGKVSISVVNAEKIKPNHTYRLHIHCRELAHLTPLPRYRPEGDALMVNDSINIFDETLNDSIPIYQENKDHFLLNNLVYQNVYGDHPFAQVDDDMFDWIINPNKVVTTDVFDGLQISLDMPFVNGEVDEDETGWVKGVSAMNVSPSLWESKYFPFEYEIIFPENGEKYVSPLNMTSKVKPHFAPTKDSPLYTDIPKDSLILDVEFPFYVQCKDMIDSVTGEYKKLGLIVYDLNANGEYDIFEDYVYAGHMAEILNTKDSTYNYAWGGTLLAIDYFNVKDEREMPKPGDVYRLKFHRPFDSDDTLRFTVLPETKADKNLLEEEMDKIKVVPNPYVVTNLFEENVTNWDKNQRRQIMFTHLPARCEIKIFTISGILVDEIKVENSIEARENLWDLNSPGNGTTFWDLKSREGLEVAPGYYIYHIKSLDSGKEKIGKFAIIK